VLPETATSQRVEPIVRQQHRPSANTSGHRRWAAAGRNGVRCTTHSDRITGNGAPIVRGSTFVTDLHARVTVAANDATVAQQRSGVMVGCRRGI
jgi:hypothetical protein